MDGEIVIRIVADDGEGKTDATGQKEVDEKQKDLETAAVTTALQKAAKQLARIGVGEVLYQTNLYFSLTDNYQAEQNLNIAKDIFSKSLSTAITATALGSKFGPAGIAIAIGIAVVETSLDIINNYQQEDINIRKQNNQLAFQRVRAGYSLTAGSRGENR